MDNAELRAIIDKAVAARQAAGDEDAVARLEIAREYFTNPTFRRALEDYSFALTRKAAP